MTMRYLRTWFALLLRVSIGASTVGAGLLWARSYAKADFLVIHRREPQGQDSCGLSFVTGSGELGLWFFRYPAQMTSEARWHVGHSIRGLDGFLGIVEDFSGSTPRRLFFRIDRPALRQNLDLYAGTPFWLLTPILSMASLLSLYRPLRRWRRARLNRRGSRRCVACGYDLRATPERCPECGAIPGA